MKKVIVTGANGQVGSEFKFLASQQLDFSFTFLSRADLDIADTDAVNLFFNGNKFDFLINCAAYTAVDKAETDTKQAYLINAESVGILAQACVENKCKLIHLSTDFIFDGTSSIPILESAETNPLSIYGASKLVGEKAILDRTANALIIRTSWVYSSFGNNFVKTILKLCKERETLNIIFDQIGTPTYARDLAAAILTIMAQPEWKPGIYNYSNEGVASWYDFAVAIKDIAGLKTILLPIETEQYPTPATRPKFSVLNKKKIKETFQISIPYWRHSLAQCMALLQ